MGSPLLLTKLYAPRVRRALVTRPRLSELLDRAPPPQLTLVSAPAGFGKTTLLAASLDNAGETGRSVAWVSLEESERDPVSFWSYVATALDATVPGVGAAALSLLQGPQPPLGTVVATLLNALSILTAETVLVLDDYHLADGPTIADDMAFLVEHLPPQVRLVISTRADPNLPLARLRARGELVELRAADLRFTPHEAAAYLNDVAGLGLEPRDVTALEGRTEGWIAALQLAALSLQGREDPVGFIAGFAGDDRYVVDYLVEEVLTRQPDAVRRFLLQTSILERLSAPLCDAVTGGADGKSMLALLDRSNMFLVPLDGNRHWYRYHHLFADVLHAHLDVELAADVSGLHQRAGRWYDAAGEPVAAVRHLLAAGDVSTAADLVERSILQLLRDRREVTARGWLDDIPEEEVAVRPVLAVGFIGALMSSGDFADVERRLDDVERLLERARTDESVKMVVVDPAELARLPGAIEMYRAGVALVGGDPSATVAHADRAIARAPEGDDVIVSAAAALSGLASWGLGDLESAHRGYSTAVVGLRRAGHYSDVLGCSITLADIRITQGRLTDAVRTYADALQLAATHEEHGVAMRGTPDMLVGLGQVALERNDLEGAAEYLSRAEQLGEHLGLPQHPYRLRVARSRMCEVRGDVAGAIELLEEADRVYVGDFSPDVRPISALRARLLLRHDRLAEALAWAGEQQLSAEDDLSYVRELEHLTLARILLRQYSVDGSTSILRNAHDLLERLQEAAEAGGRAGTLIEILTVQALARHAGGADASGTLEPLERALRLAEPEGPVRVFVDEGVPLRGLLATLAHQHRAWEYPRRLLAAYGAPGPTPTHAAPDVGLVDPLSARELDVLRLLATDLAGPAIARQLVVSLNTVRTHTKNIYAKLGVNNRREAVTRAGLLDLLSPSGSR